MVFIMPFVNSTHLPYPAVGSLAVSLYASTLPYQSPEDFAMSFPGCILKDNYNQ